MPAIKSLSTKFLNLNSVNVDFSEQNFDSNTKHFEEQLTFRLQVQEIKELLIGKCIESVSH